MKPPKEYAKELVEKYLRIEDNTTFYWDAYYDRRLFDEQVLYHAKKCALIAVQYIINANPHSNPLNTEVHSTMKFWEQVKTEINNLK